MNFNALRHGISTLEKDWGDMDPDHVPIEVTIHIAELKYKLRELEKEELRKRLPNK